MVKQPIEDLGGVPHTDGDDLGAERRILIGDGGIEELARLGSIPGVDLAGAFGLTSSLEALSA
jgi:hypothetical protein